MLSAAPRSRGRAEVLVEFVALGLGEPGRTRRCVIGNEALDAAFEGIVRVAERGADLGQGPAGGRVCERFGRDRLGHGPLCLRVRIQAGDTAQGGFQRVFHALRVVGSGRGWCGRLLVRLAARRQVDDAGLAGIVFEQAVQGRIARDGRAHATVQVDRVEAAFE